jgi:hypothetical protein
MEAGTMPFLSTCCTHIPNDTSSIDRSIRHAVESLALRSRSYNAAETEWPQH